LVQRPFYPEGESVCHTYLLHPPASIVGGDDLCVNLDFGTRAHGLVTTPAATRWCFSHGLVARMRQRATLADGATLEWLPQETLLFDGAHARLSTRIDLDGGARFFGWEVLGFGRPACGEVFLDGRIDSRFEVYRNGRPLLLERMRSGIGGIPGLRGQAAYATCIATPADPSAVDAARRALGAAADALCGATLIGDVLVCRGIAARCEPLMAAFLRLWSTLRPSVLGRVAVPPRIWHT